MIVCLVLYVILSCIPVCRYIYYYENENPSIQVRFISGLVAIINEQLGEDGSQASPAVGAHYRNTLGKNKFVVVCFCVDFIMLLLLLLLIELLHKRQAAGGRFESVQL